MPGRVWARSEDRMVEWVSMREDQLAGAIDVMRESFFPNENISKALRLNERTRASAQTERLAKFAANDGVSIVAVEVATGRVIGVAFNKIQVNCPLHTHPLRKGETGKTVPSRGIAPYILHLTTRRR